MELMTYTDFFSGLLILWQMILWAVLAVGVPSLIVLGCIRLVCRK